MPVDDPAADAVGLVGLGRMGEPMARNILAAGHPVVVFDIDPHRCEDLATAGATVVRSPAEVASITHLSITMLMNDAILRDVVLGEQGILAGARHPHVLCDLSTVSPQVSDQVAVAARAVDVGFLCGKVSGSIGLAREGTLTIFASGDRRAFDTARGVLDVLGRTVLHVGTGVEASVLKLVHSTIVGVYSAMLGEALTFGEKGGIDLAAMVDILEGGPLASSQLTLKAPVLRDRAFDDPPSDVDTAAKDIDLVLSAAQSMGAPMPLTAAVRQMMSVHQAHGRGKRDIYSILESFEELAALDPVARGA